MVQKEIIEKMKQGYVVTYFGDFLVHTKKKKIAITHRSKQALINKNLIELNALSLQMGGGHYEFTK